MTDFEEIYNENIMAQESMLNRADDWQDYATFMNAEEKRIKKSDDDYQKELEDTFDFSEIEEIPYE